MATPRRSRLPLDLGLFRAGQRVCCAISGGADSTALLLALLDANAARESLGVVLSAIHIHHNLRGESADADEAFLRDLCERLGIPLTVVRVDTPARQATEREGVEEAARALRYEAFRRHQASGAADLVATAHTLDDQAETVIMKLLRGAWTEGLGGISPVVEPETALPAQPAAVLPAQRPAAIPLRATTNRPRQIPSGSIVRPLLAMRRAAVEAFLRDRGQIWCEDATNRDLTLTRSRIRHELMPMLRGFNPQIDELLAGLAATAREEENFWQAEVAAILPGLLLPGKPVRGGGRAVSTAAGEQSCALELERLSPLAQPLRRRLLRAAARSVGCRLNAEQTVRLLALAGFSVHPHIEARPGARQEFAGGLTVERSIRELRFSRRGTV